MERHARAETGGELPPPEIVAGEAEPKARRMERNVESALSRPHHHAGDFQSGANHRLLRIFQLGAGAVGLAGHRGHQIARLHFHHRDRRSDRPADRCLFCRPLRAQMADSLGGDRHRRVRIIVRATDRRRRRDRMRPIDNALQQLARHSRSTPIRPSFIRPAFAPRRSASFIRGAGFPPSSPASSSPSFSAVTARSACSLSSPARW